MPSLLFITYCLWQEPYIVQLMCFLVELVRVVGGVSCVLQEVLQTVSRSRRDMALERSILSRVLYNCSCGHRMQKYFHMLKKVSVCLLHSHAHAHAPTHTHTRAHAHTQTHAHTHKIVSSCLCHQYLSSLTLSRSCQCQRLLQMCLQISYLIR